MQFHERGVIQGEEQPRVGFPAVFETPYGNELIPDHGEHTGEVLRAVGYDATTIEQMRENGMIS